MSNAFQTKVEHRPDGLHLIALYNGEPVGDFLILDGPHGPYGFYARPVYVRELHNGARFTRLHLSDEESRQIETARMPTVSI
jgi:hypothetical protein